MKMFKFDIYTQPDEKGCSKKVGTAKYPTLKQALAARNALSKIKRGMHIVESNLPEFGKRKTLQVYGGYKTTKIVEE